MAMSLGQVADQMRAGSGFFSRPPISRASSPASSRSMSAADMVSTADDVLKVVSA